MTMMHKVLFDVLLNDRFVCQLSYTKEVTTLTMDDGKELRGVHFIKNEIKNYVISKKPSLRGRDFQVAFTNQRLIHEDRG